MADTSSLGFIFSMAALPLFITGLIGNVLVIRIVHKTRQMHTTTNYLLANLAVGDVLNVLLQWPSFFIFSQLSSLDDGYARFICKFTAVSSIPILVSSFTLTLLAMERYHALLKPFRTGLRLNQDNIKRAVTAVWISSILFCFPKAFLRQWNKKHLTCAHKDVSKVYSILTFLVSTYMPLAIFLFCYESLIKGLYFTHTICATDTADQDRSAEKKKLVITFILATGGFVIGYGPVAVYGTVIILSDSEHARLDAALLPVFYFLFFCSLCLNPILYAFRSAHFQQGFKWIIFCRERQPENDIQMSQLTQWSQRTFGEWSCNSPLTASAFS